MESAVGNTSSLTPVLAVGAVTLLAVWMWRVYHHFGTWKRLGVPGPTPLPIVGNMLSLNKMGLIEGIKEYQKQYGNVYGLYMPMKPALVICDLDMVKEVMVKKFSVFANRQPQAVFSFRPWKYTLLSLRDDQWKHVRSTLSPTFSSGKLKKILPALERVVQGLCDRVTKIAQDKEPVELKDLCGSFSLDAIAAVAFGQEVDSLHNKDEEFVRQSKDLVRNRPFRLGFFLMFPWLVPLFRRFGITPLSQSAAQFFVNMSDSALAERRKENKKYNDFLQLLVEAEKENKASQQIDAEIDHRNYLETSTKWMRKGLNRDEMLSNAFVFLLAGYDTVSSVLSFTLFSLAANPHCLQKARKEVDEKLGKKTVTYQSVGSLTYLDMCINETMRLYPPGFLMDREASEDVEIGGYHIPKNTRIILPFYTLHTDPNTWPDPMKYDPERHTPEATESRHQFSFMPFGMGPRNCIGMRLGQLEVRMALATILQHFSPVLCKKSVYPPRLMKLRMMGEDGLWVKFEPRA